MYPHRSTFSITVVDVKHTYCRYWPTRHVNESVSSTARRRERAGNWGVPRQRVGRRERGSPLAPCPAHSDANNFCKPQYLCWPPRVPPRLLVPLHGRSFLTLLRATRQRGTHLAWRAGTSEGAHSFSQARRSYPSLLRDREFGLPFLRRLHMLFPGTSAVLYCVLPVPCILSICETIGKTRSRYT